PVEIARVPALERMLDAGVVGEVDVVGNEPGIIHVADVVHGTPVFVIAFVTSHGCFRFPSPRERSERRGGGQGWGPPPPPPRSLARPPPPPFASRMGGGMERASRAQHQTLSRSNVGLTPLP